MKPIAESIEVGRALGRHHAWSERWSLVEPLLVESMCEVQRLQALDETSLGAFRPARVDEVIATRVSPEWSSDQKAVLSQISLFAMSKELLEKIPYRFQYRYTCGPACSRRNGHRQAIVDWEVAQAYRRWRREYGEHGAVERIRMKWLDEICGADKDTVFFVGNQRRWTRSFMVLGTFWPPKAPRQADLFGRLGDYRH